MPAPATGTPEVDQAAGGDDEAWRGRRQVNAVLAQMQLDPAARFEGLSAGLKRRVLLARGLVTDPDLCCWTSRPTISTSTPSPGWRISSCASAARSVRHPRPDFSPNAGHADRRDSTAGGSRLGLRLRIHPRPARQPLEAEAAAGRIRRKLAQEEVWIRQGIKARRTRNEGRVRALEGLRRERRGAERTAARCACGSRRRSVRASW